MKMVLDGNLANPLVFPSGRTIFEPFFPCVYVTIRHDFSAIFLVPLMRGKDRRGISWLSDYEDISPFKLPSLGGEPTRLEVINALARHELCSLLDDAFGWRSSSGAREGERFGGI